MVNINPADCLPHEVYEGTADGERWTMQRVNPQDYRLPWFCHRPSPGISLDQDLTWVSDAEASDLVRLVPARPVTRNDLPKIGGSDVTSDFIIESTLDTVVHHLNKHGGVFADSERSSLLDRLDRQSASIGILQRERDDLDSRCAQLMSDFQDVEDERDEAVEACRLFQQDAHKWRAKAEAPTVTREQVADELKTWSQPGMGREPLVDLVCRLFGIEAEQPDPVEAKARELYGAANAGTPWGAVVQSANEGNRVDREVVREYRAIAAHVLGQETNQ